MGDGFAALVNRDNGPQLLDCVIIIPTFFPDNAINKGALFFRRSRFRVTNPFPKCDPFQHFLVFKLFMVFGSVRH
jgi:hypothetical protein